MKATIHFFSYGENQIISENLNFKTNASAFKKAKAVIDDIKSLKPADIEASDYHSINIFGGIKVSYLSKEENKSYSFDFSKLDKTKLDALVAEFGALKASYDAAKKNN